MEHCYVNDKELALRLEIDHGTLGLLRNQKGFPPKDPITKRWYWPAVVTWLDRRHHVGDPFFGTPHEEENDDALAMRFARVRGSHRGGRRYGGG